MRFKPKYKSCLWSRTDIWRDLLCKEKTILPPSGIPLWVFSVVVDVVGDLYQKPEANIKLSVLRILCVITISLFNSIHVQIKLLSIISGGIVIHYRFYFVYVGFMVI